MSTLTTWDLLLPYPSPPLRSNDRMHWAVKARLVAEIRRDTHHMARFLRLPRGLDRVEIVLNWQPNLARKRDGDSVWGTLKPAVDGLVDYGLVVDDDIGHVRSGCVIHPLAVTPRVWLSITDESGVQ